MADTLLLQLLDKYTTHSITEKEKQELYSLLQSPDHDTELETIIDNQFQSSVFELPEDGGLRQVIFKRIQQKLQEPAKVKNLGPWKRWTVAASLALLTGIGSYFAFFNKEVPTQDSPGLVADIPAPKSTKAVITLADGKIIAVDTFTRLAQGNVVVNKTTDGKLIYQSSGNHSASTIQYNTLTNPRGSKVIDMVLADGSQVWLNAGSSVTYPVAFVGNERRVSVTGEAYFEVAHNASKPFYVSKDDISVQVLGTHFNVNAYDDENDIKVTLLQGSVSVGNQLSTVKIKPGEQAVAMKNGKLGVENNVEVEQVMAWKNGKFVFGEKADIQTIMRQIARWYDVTVEYRGNVNGFIGGSISRDVSISDVLRMLEKTGEVKFKIERNKITVLP